jgi:hypothetical protein
MPIGEKDVWAQRRSGRCGEKKYFLPLPKIEIRFLLHTTLSPSPSRKCFPYSTKLYVQNKKHEVYHIQFVTTNIHKYKMNILWANLLSVNWPVDWLLSLFQLQM